MKVWGRKGDSKLVIDYDKKEKEKKEAKRPHEELQLQFESINQDHLQTERGSKAKCQKMTKLLFCPK